MDIGIIGAGAIGSFYAAMLSRAGHRVRMHARGAHLAAVRERGLEIRASGSSFVTHPEAVTDSGGLGTPDCVIVAVKGYSLGEVAPLVAAAAARGATVVPLLNGVDAAERLAHAGVPRSSIIGGLCQVSVFRTAPGVVEWRSAFNRVTVGEFDGTASARVTALVDALTAAGFDARASAEITRDLWRKFALIVPMSLSCGLSRTAMGPLLATEGGRMLLERSLGELVAVSRAAGADAALSDDDQAHTLKTLLAVDAPIMPSFLHDLVKGGPTEVDSLCGTVSRLGRVHGVPTPVCDVATAAFVAATLNSR
jgi:2-dehydropantoate 2-reductase